jgi:hypothetical protein
MKMRWIVLVLMLTASLAFAQTPAGTKANTKRSTPFSKKTAKTTKTAAPKTMAPKTTTPKTMTSKAATPSTAKAKPATTAAATPKVAKPKAAKKEKPAAAPVAPETASTEAGPGSGRKRDPFISPVQARLEGMNSACSTGVRCLAVNEIVLRGVVKSANGMIAVVENAAQKTYFLHENQPIYNGFVERITPDSVIFKEHYLDNLGHDSQREIVKTVNAPVV